MSTTTNWLPVKIVVSPKPPDYGQVQLTYTIENGSLQTASLSWRESNTSPDTTLFTNTSGVSPSGVAEDKSTGYSLKNFKVDAFEFYQNSTYNFVNALNVTVASDGTVTLSGKFSNPPDEDTSCDWVADATAPWPHEGTLGVGANA
jgi:hypothetical protein